MRICTVKPRSPNSFDAFSSDCFFNITNRPISLHTCYMYMYVGYMLALKFK